MQHDDSDKKDAVNHGWVVAARPGRGESGDDVMIEFEDGSIGWVHGDFARVMGHTPQPASPETIAELMSDESLRKGERPGNIAEAPQ